MAAQLPGALDRGASAEALDLVRVNAAQQIRRQHEPAQQLEFVDLSQQALQSDPPRIGDETGERRTLAVVGQQSVQTPARAGVEAICYALQRCVVVRGAGGAQDAVETVRAGSGNPPAREPAGDLFLQHRRSRLPRQQLLREPAAERGLSLVVKADDREMAKDGTAMPASGAAHPIVAVEGVDPDADLRGQVPDHRWGEVGLVVGKPALLAPVRELRSQAELAGVRQVGQQPQVLGQERPVRAKLVRRPQPLHHPTSVQPRDPRLRPGG